MKLAFTLANYGAAANVGGDVERETHIVELPDESLPSDVRDHLTDPNIRKWQTLCISILKEGAV